MKMALASKIQANPFVIGKLRTEDFRMYFDQSFVYQEAKDPSSLTYVNGVDENIVVCYGLKGAYEVPRKDFSCSLEKPEDGFYQYGDDLMLLTGLPYRGTLKGFNKKNTLIQPLCNWKGPFSAGTFRWNSPQVFDLLINKDKDLDFGKALSSVKSRQVFGAPVTRSIAITQGYKNDFPALWFHLTPCGHILKEDTVVVTRSEFFDEIESSLPKGIKFITRPSKNQVKGAPSHVAS
jgi:hypothetical protein